ncbi:thiamine biosynthesis lipoprotein [Paenibacillus cellulosilyticus]|uniref:FAD:protein FMN transferase n=1 Tax=Paenibacillus cellulosilyticus TaxID=375489 RepID=A0A2V2YPZ8_9BACL|nr:FAD:protein FMN transferase [Paenibacillus cellulosilyticus]PWV98464.1 thiamine biosynthesis lipoprotein [Paenibacillus cellulosilyticus]QKS43306.1 FAD:protein FMN transferase [Paenibacillus cellulosilyticus]
MTSGVEVMKPMYYRFRAMNTDIELSLVCDGYAMSEAVELAVDWYEEVEQVFSRFRPDSELSRINRTAGSGAPVMISSMMRDVLQLTLWYQQTTGGIFSPFVGGSMNKAGYDRSFELLSRVGMSRELLDDDIHDNVEQVVDIKRAYDGRMQSPMVLDIAMQSVQLVPGTQLDLGGIVKGWATAKLSQWLCMRYGIRAGLVNAGGDLHAWNDGNGEPIWRIDVQDPIAGDDGTIYRMMGQGAVATSGTLGRQWRTGQGVAHHLIDTRTGCPSRSGIVQCTVSGPDLIACEVWAKTICIQGEAALQRMTSQLPPSYDALIIDQQGMLRYTGPAWLKEEY